jgi:hypothetical protein
MSPTTTSSLSRAILTVFSLLVPLALIRPPAYQAPDQGTRPGRRCGDHSSREMCAVEYSLSLPINQMSLLSFLSSDIKVQPFQKKKTKQVQ